MSFSFAGYPCLDPRPLYEQCLQQELPIQSAPWLGQVNSFRCPLGCEPGRGWLLLDRGSIDKLKPGEGSDAFAELIIASDDGLPLKLPKILLTGFMEAVTFGDPGDVMTAYAVQIADKRWLYWQRGIPLTKAYNLRGDNDGAYVPATLNAGTAWTWQQLLDDLWPAGLGASPTLPFTPDGTPENFWFHAVSKLQAVDHLLDRLACALLYDPIADTFSVVRLGLTTSATATTANYLTTLHSSRLIMDDYVLATRTALLPETLRVEFPVKFLNSDRTPSYHAIDKTVDPAAGALASGTYILLQDDLTALNDGAGSFTNLAALGTRATERASDWTRQRRYFETGIRRSYSGFLNLTGALGSLWNEVAWEDRGGEGLFGGRKTMLAGSGLRRPWKRIMSDSPTLAMQSVPVRVTSTTLGAGGYPARIQRSVDGVTFTEAAATDCWVRDMNGHVVFAKRYDGTFVANRSADNLPIFVVEANEDTCRSEFEGSFTTVQNYNGAVRQFYSHDTAGWGDWVNSTGPDDSQNVLATGMFQPRVMTANPALLGIQLQQMADAGAMLMGQVFGG